MPDSFSMEGNQDWDAPVTATPIEDLRALKALATKHYGRRFIPLDELVRFTYNPAEQRKGKGDPQGGEWTAGGPTGGPDVHGTWQEGEGSLGSPNAAVGQGGANPPNQPGYQGAAMGPHVIPITASNKEKEEKDAIAFVAKSTRMMQGKVKTREDAVRAMLAGAEATFANSKNRTAVAWTHEGQTLKRDQIWYYHANALSRHFAHSMGYNNSTAAGSIAAYSPQSAWIFPEQETPGPSPTSAKKALKSDVRLAQRTLDQVANHAQDDIVIDQRAIDIWENGVKTPVYVEGHRKYKTGEAFDENDPAIDHFKYPGKSAYGSGRYTGPETEFQGFVPKVGTYKQQDLPTEYLVDLWARDQKVNGMHDMMVNAAMIARGHSVDEVLRGVKTRSFYNDIVDPQHTDSVTIDVHMLRAMMQNEGIDSQDSGAIGTAPGGYAMAVEAVQRGAALHGMRPHEYQAIVWEEWRKENPPKKRSAAVKADPSIARDPARKQDSAAAVRHAMRQPADQATMSELVWFAAGPEDVPPGPAGDIPIDGADPSDYSKPEKLGPTLNEYNVSQDEPPWDDPEYQDTQEQTLALWEQLGEKDHAANVS